MPLLNLPYELIFTVLENLCSARDIDALGQTNRVLHHLATEYLCQNAHRNDAFLWAAAGGRPTTLQMLLRKRAGLQLKEDRLYLPLVIAADKGYGVIVKLLLDAGMSINADSGYYGNALDAAAFRGHAHIVKLVLNACAVVNFNDRRFHRCRWRSKALKTSSRLGHEQVVELLLDAGAPVNEDGDRRISALQMAEAEGHEQVVKLLLRAGADVDY